MANDRLITSWHGVHEYDHEYTKLAKRSVAYCT
jgi:hypothetical protein